MKFSRPMKISLSLSLSALILVLGGIFRWQEHQRLEIIRASHALLVAEAAGVGITIDSTQPEANVRLTKYERKNNTNDVKKIVSEFIACAREMAARKKQLGLPDEAAEQRISEFIERMMALDAADLKSLITEVRTNSEVDSEARDILINLTISNLANGQALAALTLLTEFSDLFGGEEASEYMISSLLAKWAKDDPLAALDWVKKNVRRYPYISSDRNCNAMISGAAIYDPSFALKLIAELQVKDPDKAIQNIVAAATSPEQRTATLAALRQYFAAQPDEKAREAAIERLASNVAQDGFEAGSKWIENAGFTPEEITEIAASGLSYNSKSEDTGKWIEWIGKNLPPEQLYGNLYNQLRSWTANDYQAAGKWLAATPNGPTKNTSIRIYAETISEYHPEVAAQWAMTLPPGDHRESTLFLIYQKWPATDPAGKVAFSKLHGFN